MPTISSVGKCSFCNTEFKKAGIFRHLNTHLEKESNGRNSGISFHIKIEDDWPGVGLFFLSLWVDGEALMIEIDDFLRDIWLECCGHLSAFTKPKKRERYSIIDTDEMESDNDEIMDSTTKDILIKGMNLKYEYDFGSTTLCV